MQQSVAPSKDPPGADRLPILEIKNLHTYFFQETGTVRAVRGVNLRLDRQSVGRWVCRVRSPRGAGTCYA